MTPEQLLAAIERYRSRYWGDPEKDRRGRLNVKTARREIVVGALASLGIGAEVAAHEIADCFSEEGEKAVYSFPGALETLQTLKREGVMLGLITQGVSELQRRKIERFGLARLFASVLIEGEFGAGKPDERVYLHTLGALRAQPHEAWMVGDNLENDVAAPQRLGIRGIWHDWAATGLPAVAPTRPDRIIRSLPELLQGP